jgi:fucose permease
MSFWTRLKNYPHLGLVVLAYVAFIALGMPDGLLGVAWPGIQESFSISLDAVGWLLAASVAGYLASTFLSGPLIARWGVGHLLAGSCALTGAALVGYTLAPAWWMMASLGIAVGLGAGAIDAALNTYAAAHFSAGTMQWMHACYGVGVTMGPIIMTAALARFDSWRLGYVIVGGAQFALAACFALTLGMWERENHVGETEQPKKLTEYQTPLGETLLESRVWLSGLLFFLAVGVEGSTGIWAYTLLVESRGMDPHLAGMLVGGYWAMFTAGRIVAGLSAGRVGVDRLVIIGLGSIFVGAAIWWWNPSWWWNPIGAANFVGLGLIGFGVAPIFPGLMSGTSARVGVRFAANTIGVQMAAAGVGNAILPSSVGALAQATSLEVIPGCVLMMCAGLLVLYPLAVRVGREANR